MTPVARISFAVLVGTVMVSARPVPAADPPVIEMLRREPTTLFDMGIKRLRRAALDTALRMTTRDGRNTLARVRYAPERPAIEIRLETTAPEAQHTARGCQDIRIAAIRDMFSIGRTAYAQPLSFSEQLRRRLGLIFAHDPIGADTAYITIGQRVAEITRVDVLLTRAGAEPVGCGGFLALPERPR